MESFTEKKVINGIIRLTYWQKIKNVHQSLTRLSSVPNWTRVSFNKWDINNIKNDLICKKPGANKSAPGSFLYFRILH